MRVARNLISRGLSQAMGYLAAVAVLAMAVLLSLDVFLRFAFNAPVPGTLAITQILLIVSIFLSFGATQKDGGHIDIDLAVELLPRGWRRYVHLVSYGVGLGITLLLVWRTAISALAAQHRGDVSLGMINVPLWPAHWVVSIGLALLAMQLCVSAIRLFRPAGGDEKEALSAPPQELAI